MTGDEPEGKPLERDTEWKTFFLNQDAMSELVINERRAQKNNKRIKWSNTQKGKCI